MSDAYDHEREEVVGDAAFDRDDRGGGGAVAFDTDEGQYAASPPDDYDLPPDLFLIDPSRKDTP